VDLPVTVTNTSRRAEAVALRYTLPEGLADAGTPGCAPTGDRSYGCAAWTVAAGARFATQIRVRVAGTAWQRLPLSGSVQVTASPLGSESGTPVSDTEGFAVLFPPGPPVPGVSLSASEVAFDVTGRAGDLVVRLGNTGRTDTTGAIEVLLPAGVSVPAPPAGCVSGGPGHTRCDLGALAAEQ
ncbi:hypothetical protein ACFQ0D_37835, partial [Micromonospora zhanjiangensis]